MRQKNQKTSVANNCCKGGADQEWTAAVLKGPEGKELICLWLLLEVEGETYGEFGGRKWSGKCCEYIIISKLKSFVLFYKRKQTQRES